MLNLKLLFRLDLLNQAQQYIQSAVPALCPQSKYVPSFPNIMSQSSNDP